MSKDAIIATLITIILAFIGFGLMAGTGFEFNAIAMGFFVAALLTGIGGVLYLQRDRKPQSLNLGPSRNKRLRRQVDEFMFKGEMVWRACRKDPDSVENQNAQTGWFLEVATFLHNEGLLDDEIGSWKSARSSSGLGPAPISYSVANIDLLTQIRGRQEFLADLKKRLSG